MHGVTGQVYFCHRIVRFSESLVRTRQQLTAGSAAGDFGAIERWPLAARGCCRGFVPDQCHNAVGAVAAQAATAVAGVALRNSRKNSIVSTFRPV